MRLGKLPALRDPRNFRLSALLRPELVIPPEYSFDDDHPGVPTPMFANDVYGDCVMAGRAHQTLRFELLEQEVIIPITDQEVIEQYLKESGGVDQGLVLLESIRNWRRRGWIAGGRNYKIKAFAEIDPGNVEEVKAACYVDLGIGIGLAMPDNWQEAIREGKPWEDTSYPPSRWNGHYVYVAGYNPSYLTCVTWGKKQPMSWEWFVTYCDEAYAIIDAPNRKKKLVALNNDLLDRMLAALPSDTATV